MSASHFESLPFVFRPTPGQSAEPSNWSTPHTDDYAAACRAGEEYAAHYIEYLQVGGLHELGLILRDVDFKDTGAERGYWVGFLGHLVRYIRAGAEGRDPFEDLSATRAEYAAAESIRRARARARRTTRARNRQEGRAT